MEEALRKIGLTNNEVKVYITLLKIKTGLAGEITKVSGIHRRSVYDAIERLIQKGLVSYALEGKRKQFQAEKPDRIRDIIQNWGGIVEDAIPKLNAVYEGGLEKQQAVIYRGKNGLKSIFDDVIEVGDNVYIYGAFGDLDKKIPYAFAQFEKKRIKKGMKVKMIYDESDRARMEKDLALATAKFLPKGFSGPVTTMIYGNRVAIEHWTDNPIIFMIRSTEVAKAYRQYFKLLWDTAKN